MAWNVNAAIDHLRASAQSTSTGFCAQYTREAIEAGGLTLKRQISAKDYGESLRLAGFRLLHLHLPLTLPAFLNFGPASPMNPFTSGGIAIFQGTDKTPGGENGHMQMCDATDWILDFVQSGFSPGPAFDGVKVQVYRHRDYL